MSYFKHLRRKTLRRKGYDSVICKHCGKGGFHFFEDENGLRLRDEQGVIHICRKANINNDYVVPPPPEYKDNKLDKD